MTHTDRTGAIAFLNDRLADSIDLQAMCRSAHWNVRGPQFIALHRLFDELGDEVGGHSDLIAERIGQLGGVAEGSVRRVCTRSTLAEYPNAGTAGLLHVAALSNAFAQLAHLSRGGIDMLASHGDIISSDIITEVTRGLEKGRWILESHRPSE